MCVCVYTLLACQYYKLFELSAVQSAVRVNYACQLCVRNYSYAAQCALGPALLQGRAMCVCVAAQIQVSHYRLSRRAAGVGVQCSAGAGRYNCVVWPCSLLAMSRYMQLRHSAVTLMTSATAAVAVILDRASPYVCMRVYTYICVYNTIQYID